MISLIIYYFFPLSCPVAQTNCAYHENVREQVALHTYHMLCMYPGRPRIDYAHERRSCRLIRASAHRVHPDAQLMPFL